MHYFYRRRKSFPSLALRKTSRPSDKICRRVTTSIQDSRKRHFLRITNGLDQGRLGIQKAVVDSNRNTTELDNWLSSIFRWF